MTELSTSYPRSYFRKSRVSVLKSNLQKDRTLLKLHPLRKIHVLMLLGWHIQHLHSGTSSKLQMSWACSVSLELYCNFHQKVNSIPTYTIQALGDLCSSTNRRTLPGRHNRICNKLKSTYSKKKDETPQVELQQTSKWAPKGRQYLFSNTLLHFVIFYLKHTRIFDSPWSSDLCTQQLCSVACPATQVFTTQQSQGKRNTANM